MEDNNLPRKLSKDERVISLLGRYPYPLSASQVGLELQLYYYDSKRILDKLSDRGKIVKYIVSPHRVLYTLSKAD